MTAIVILVCISVFYYDSFKPSEPVIVNETVTAKDISHWRADNFYNIYTSNNSFRVDLTVYNEISVGDNLTVEYCDLGFPELHYKDRLYCAT